MAAAADVLRWSRWRVWDGGMARGLGGAPPAGLPALLDCECCATALTDLLGLARVHFINGDAGMDRSRAAAAAGPTRRPKPHAGHGLGALMGHPAYSLIADWALALLKGRQDEDGGAREVGHCAQPLGGSARALDGAVRCGSAVARHAAPWLPSCLCNQAPLPPPPPPPAGLVQLAPLPITLLQRRQGLMLQHGAVPAVWPRGVL